MFTMRESGTGARRRYPIRLHSLVGLHKLLSACPARQISQLVTSLLATYMLPATRRSLSRSFIRRLSTETNSTSHIEQLPPPPLSRQRARFSPGPRPVQSASSLSPSTKALPYLVSYQLVVQCRCLVSRLYTSLLSLHTSAGTRY